MNDAVAQEPPRWLWAPHVEHETDIDSGSIKIVAIAREAVGEDDRRTYALGYRVAREVIASGDEIKRYSDALLSEIVSGSRFAWEKAPGEDALYVSDRWMAQRLALLTTGTEAANE